MRDRIKTYVYDYYYVSVILIYLVAIYVPAIRVGVTMSAMMMFLVYYMIKNRLFTLRNNLDILVFVYCAYNTISLVWFLLSDLPIDVYIMEYSNSILPIIVFYFLGRVNRKDNSFYTKTWFALIACFIIGFYYQVNLPENYREYMAKLDNTGGTDLSQFILYYRSILGLTATGSLAAIGVLISLAKLVTSKAKKGKIALIICFFALILTFRRSALYVGVFAFLWINYLAVFKLRVSKSRLLLFEIVIIIFMIGYMSSLDPDFINGLTDRFGALSDAIGERNSSWFDGLANTKNVILGDGLGRYGHKAALFSEDVIPDGNYFRILSELGIVGMGLFIGVIFTAIKRGFANLQECYVEIGIIIMVCLQAVGSDVFSFQLVAPIFWYAIGRCARKLQKGPEAVRARNWQVVTRPQPSGLKFGKITS